MTDQTVEYLCIITLPQAEVFAATDVLNLMALAVRNRDNDAPPDYARPSILRWDSPTRVNTPGNLSARSHDDDQKKHAANQPHEIPKQEEPQLIWDDRAERIKSSLFAELYQAVRNGQLNLWNFFCDMPKAPPSDIGDIDFWIATSSIYRSDLIKFCRSQKIKVEITPIAPQPEAKETFNQYDAASRIDPNQDVSRPPHWADYKELALAFPSVGRTDAATLEWFKKGSSDRKRASGFKEAQIKGTGKKGRGNKTQFDIFVVAKYLLVSGIVRPAAIVAGLRKHLGASLEDYQDQYEDLFSSAPYR